MIYQRIKSLRTEKGISPKDMAERLHKSLSAYYSMESGEIKIDAEELPAIIEALETNLEEFFKDATTINIQQNNHQPHLYSNVQNVYNESEKLLNQFQTLIGNVQTIVGSMLSYMEKSEERSQKFMKAMMERKKE